MSNDERMAAYLAGDLAPADRAAFEREILADPKRFAELVEQQCMDAGLRALLDPNAQRVESAIMASVRSVSEEAAVEQVLADTVRARHHRESLFSRWLQSLRRAPAFWAGAAAIAGIAVWAVFRFHAGEEANELVEAPAPGIAQLTHGTGIVWETNAEQQIGEPLAPGWLRLKSGSVEIEFASGAQAILEGPAELHLISPMEAELSFGKISAQVPLQAHGFSVTAGGTKVIDLGTAFGVSKPSGGPVEVDVFTGKVEVASAAIQPPRQLTQGQAIRVGTSGAAELAANHSEFVSQAELREKEASELRARYEAWKKTSAGLDSDPALLVHYNFEGAHQPGDVLTNHASVSRPETQGSIVGCNWVEGRWPGKGALEFHQRDNHVRLKVSGVLTSLTYVVWVQLDSLPRPVTAVAMAQNFAPGEVQFQINHNGTLHLGVRLQPPGSGNEWDSIDTRRVLTSKSFGQWIQLAAVYDGTGKAMALYVNGKRVASKPLQQPVNLVLNDLELGDWDPLLVPTENRSERRQRTRPSIMHRELYGRMDEFALLSRPLSDNEIRKLYEEGEPRSSVLVVGSAR